MTNATLTCPSRTHGEPSAYSQCIDAGPDVPLVSDVIAATQYSPAGCGWKGAIRIAIKLLFIPRLLKFWVGCRHVCGSEE
jgi:hypothetical protein